MTVKHRGKGWIKLVLSMPIKDQCSHYTDFVLSLQVKKLNNKFLISKIQCVEWLGFCLSGSLCFMPRVSGVSLCADINCWCSISSQAKLIMWRLTKSRNLSVRVCHGRFYDILEHSLGFFGKYEFAIKRDANDSQILSLIRLTMKHRNIYAKQTFYHK